MTKIPISIIFIMFELVFFHINVLAQRQIELEKRWGFITPCVTTKVEVEKILGSSINKDKNETSQTYESENEKITVVYDKEDNSNNSCGVNLPKDTVIRFFAVPFDKIKLSELKVDLAKYVKNATRSPREIWYTNEAEGILIVTEILPLENNTKSEMVIHVGFDPKPINGKNRDLDPSKEHYDKDTHSFYSSKISKRENFDIVVARFDNFIASWKASVKEYERGYVIVYFDNKLPVKEYRSHLNKIKKFVYKRHNLSPSILPVVEGGLKEKAEIEFYFLRKDQKTPIPNP